MTALNQASFTGGELAPSLHARADLAKYATGLAECRGFIIHPHGGVSNRPGTEFAAEVKDHSKQVRLIEFEFSTIETYVLEFGDLYIRFYRNGGRIVYPAGHASEGQVVEISTPYTEDQLFELKFVQSADVITLTHSKHKPRNLSRSDHHEWNLDVISFVPQISKPTGLAASDTGIQSYQVTAVAKESFEESLPASVNGIDNASLSWNAVTNAAKYNVYKRKNGIYGYIGSTDAAQFDTENLLPVLDDTPPTSRNPFSGSQKYPEAVTYFQQRQFYGASLNEPQKIWSTQSGNYTNMNTSSPSKDDDAITLTIAARKVNKIRHFVPLKSLIILTSGGEWVLNGGDNGILTPTNVNPDQEGERGSSDVPPIVVGGTVLYVQSRGSTVRDLAYTFESDGYSGNDLSILANHLFEGHQIIDWCYAQTPDSIVWCVRDDGKLLGLTYMREHEVWGWHLHETEGEFESVCSVPEGDEDAVYFVVKRTINGQEKRYIERLHTRRFDVVEDAFFVDSGLSYEGPEVSVISGLDHLEGKAVSVLSGGNVEENHVVISGSITLQQPSTKVHIGLPYESRLKLLKVDFSSEEFGSSNGKTKTITEAHIDFMNSRGGWIGTNDDNLVELLQREDENWGEPTRLQTGNHTVDIDPEWDQNGQLLFVQRDPLPISIRSITPEVKIAA